MDSKSQTVRFPQARQGKALHGLKIIEYAIKANKSLTIGCADPDSMYNRIKAEYPEAKISKGKGFVRVEKSK